jgi:hypothetical protein
VASAWPPDGTQLSLGVTVPVGTTATVRVPSFGPADASGAARGRGADRRDRHGDDVRRRRRGLALHGGTGAGAELDALVLER